MLKSVVARRTTMHEITPDRNAARRCALCAVLALIAVDAAAQETTPPSARGALRVDAAERCATRDAIVARVAERSQRIELVDDAPLVLRAVVQESTRNLVSAELHVTWPDGRTSLRRLNAPSCAEALDALALLITLTLDPSAALTPANAEKEPVITEAPPAAESKSPASEPQPQPQPESESESRASPTSEPFALSHVAFGLAAHGLLGVAPRLMPGIGASALVAFDGHGLWTPLLQVRVTHAWASATEAAGTADFQLDRADLVACVIGLRSATLAARACVTGAIGRLHARGSETYDPNDHARLWVSAGAELLLSAELVGPLQLQAGAGLAVPLRRDRFAFAPRVFHRVAAAVLYGHLGLAVRFP
jgi:hypothetical protein